MIVDGGWWGLGVRVGDGMGKLIWAVGFVVSWDGGLGNI